MSFYIADGGVDNDSDSGERDGAIYEVEIERSSNRLPTLADQGFVVAENAPPGTLVGTVLGSDPDPGDALSYSIAAGNPDDTFSIEPGSGQIRVAGGGLDFENTPRIELLIRAHDDGSPSLFDTARVSVDLLDQNEPPVVETTSLGVDEHSPIGAVVGTVTASGPEPGDVLRYTITSDKSKAFAIDASSGRITVRDDRLLDFEMRSSFALKLRVEDDGGLASTAEMTVRLRDVNEAPVVQPVAFAVEPDSPAGTVVGVVQALDPDGDALRFSIPDGDPGDALTIDDQGVLTVADPEDLASGAPFELTVRARDDGDPRLSGTATVVVALAGANTPPQVQPASFLIDEHSALGSVVGTVSASDPDGVVLSIVAGNKGNAFAIDPASGRITVARPSAIDFEKTPRFDLTVQALDDGLPPLASTAPVTVRLRDVPNDP